MTLLLGSSVIKSWVTDWEQVVYIEDLHLHQEYAQVDQINVAMQLLQLPSFPLLE